MPVDLIHAQFARSHVSSWISSLIGNRDARRIASGLAITMHAQIIDSIEKLFNWVISVYYYRRRAVRARSERNRIPYSDPRLLLVGS